MKDVHCLLVRSSSAVRRVRRLLLGPGVLGLVLSGLAGLLALRWLSAWLEQGRWRYFGYYCCGFAAVVLLAAWRGW